VSIPKLRVSMPKQSLSTVNLTQDTSAKDLWLCIPGQIQ